MNERQLFIHTLQNLENNLKSDDEYDTLMIALLLRKLLLDKYPLVDQVRKQTKIKFTINDCQVPSAEPGLEFCSLEDDLDPSVTIGLRQIEVTRDKLFSYQVLVYKEHVVTIRELILHVANVQGAVHAGMAKDEKDKALKQLTEAFGIVDLPAGFNLLRVIGRIVRKGLEPLRTAIEKEGY